MSPKRNRAVEVLERRRTVIDTLIEFLKKHPKTTADVHVKGLDGGKNGLSFPDYALIVPYWNGGDVQLRLLKSGEDWIMNLDSDAYENLERVAAVDVSDISNEDLERLLDGMYREANPDEEDG